MPFLHAWIELDASEERRIYCRFYFSTYRDAREAQKLLIWATDSEESGADEEVIGFASQISALEDMPSPPPPPPPPSPSPEVESEAAPTPMFTERLRRVLSLAQEEAKRFNHNYIGTEHILLGLSREPEGVGTRTLIALGADLNKIRAAVEFIIGKGKLPPTGDVGLTPRAKKVIELAVDEARQMNHHYIGTEHLLIGLLREGEGVAAQVLDGLGVTLSDAQEMVVKLLSKSAADLHG